MDPNQLEPNPITEIPSEAEDHITEAKKQSKFHPDLKICTNCKEFGNEIPQDPLCKRWGKGGNLIRLIDECPLAVEFKERWDEVDKSKPFTHDSIMQEIEIATMAINEAKDHDKDWYEGFEKWLCDVLKFSDSQGELSLLRWDLKIQEWFIYSNNKGVWEIISIEELHQYIIKWAKIVGRVTNKSMFEHGISRLKSILLYKSEWNPEEFINCLNGLYCISTKLFISHTPRVNSTQQFQFNYRPIQERNSTPLYDKICETYPENMKIFESMVQNTLFQDFSDEMFFIMVGPTRTGKGTILQLLSKAFGSFCVSMQIHSIGERFGLAPLVGKRVLLDPEMSAAYITTSCLREIKDTVSHENNGIKIIEEKYKRKYDAKLNFFIFGATNQLCDLPAKLEKKAWFSRLILSIFDKPQNPNPQFKRDIIKEIDDIFSKIIDTDYPSIRPNMADGLSEYAKKTEIKWNEWADPVRAICFRFFEKDLENKNNLDVEDCWRYIKDELEIQGLSLKDQYIKIHTTQSLNVLGIEKKQHRTSDGRVYRYCGIKIKDENLIAKIEEEKKTTESVKEDGQQPPDSPTVVEQLEDGLERQKNEIK